MSESKFLPLLKRKNAKRRIVSFLLLLEGETYEAVGQKLGGVKPQVVQNDYKAVVRELHKQGLFEEPHDYIRYMSSKQYAIDDKEEITKAFSKLLAKFKFDAHTVHNLIQHELINKQVNR